jgi:hypothetical protein
MSNELDDMFDSLLGGLEDITSPPVKKNDPPPTKTPVKTEKKDLNLDDLISEFTPTSSYPQKTNPPPKNVVVHQNPPKQETPKVVQQSKGQDVDKFDGNMNLNELRNAPQNKTPEIKNKMYSLGYALANKRPTTVVVDTDGNIATSFRFMGTQTASLGKIHTITVIPVDDSDQQTPLYNYNKYVTMEAIDLNNGQEMDVYCKDNGDKSYDFSFLPQALGLVNVEILLCGGTLFELQVSVENIQAGDWVARTNPQHQLGEPLKIEIVRKDDVDAVLPGPLPFKVDASGNMQNLEIESNDDGTCCITALPMAQGRMQFTVTLHDQHISNSPLNIFVVDKSKVKTPTLNPTVNQPSYGNATVNLKPSPINPVNSGNTGVYNVTPKNMTPMNSGNNGGVYNVTPMNMTPMNSGNTGGVYNVTPMNMTPMNSGNSMNSGVRTVNPVNSVGGNVINVTPMNPMNSTNRTGMGLNPINTGMGNTVNRPTTGGINPIGMNPVNRFSTNPVNPINNRASLVNLSSIGGNIGGLGGNLGGNMSGLGNLGGNMGGLGSSGNLGNGGLGGNLGGLGGNYGGLGGNLGGLGGNLGGNLGGLSGSMGSLGSNPRSSMPNINSISMNSPSNIGDSLDDLLESISDSPKPTNTTPVNKKQSSVDELELMMKELQDYQ